MLITTLAAGLAAALVLGYLALRLRLPPIVGYLVAGLLLGPYTPGFVADRETAEQFAEIGVILLMFGVGLHFHLKDLLAVRRIAVTGGLVQIACATALGVVSARWFGWSLPAGLVFGIAISMASTVVLTRVLSDGGDLQSPAGRIAIGWLIVEDIFAVFALVALPVVLGPGNDGRAAAWASGAAAAKLAGVGVLILWGGGRVLPMLLAAVARTRSRELFTLTVLTIALGLAAGSAKVFGVSMALGAFLAGMVVGRSEFSYRAASEALPMRDAFAVLFFVSVGMLFDPQHLLRAPWQVAATVAIVMLAKPAAAFLVALVLRAGARVGLRVAVALAQIGEFSFILASMGEHLGILPPEAMHSVVAASIASIAVNPLLYRALPWLERKWLRAPAGNNAPPPEPSEFSHTAIVVGYGPVGETVSRLLRDKGIDPTVVELNPATLKRIGSDGFRAVHGDASRPGVLKSAGAASAGSLILSAPGAADSAEMIRTARELNPAIHVLARGAFHSSAAPLRAAGADEVFSGETEVAMAMIEAILLSLRSTPEQVDDARRQARAALRRDRP